MAFGRLRTIRNLYRAVESRPNSSRLGILGSFSGAIPTGPQWRGVSCWSYKDQKAALSNNKFSKVCCRSISSCLCKFPNAAIWTSNDQKTPHSMVGAEHSILLRDARLVMSLMTQAKAPNQGGQTSALKVSMLSPGIIYEPYAPRDPISFWQRWFTRRGWRRTKDDIILELKSAYAINKLRKCGYSKQKFYKEAVELYKEINIFLANGDKASLRKAVTETMYSGLKNEIKLREQRWSSIYWELIEPIIKIRTLRARLIGVDRNDLNKVFVQLTLEFLSKQKFEAYDYEGLVVAGDKNKEVLVRDIWVFEKSLFHTGAYWRLCGRMLLQPSKK